MIRNFLEAATKAKQEAQYWLWAALTLPFIALAILTFEYYLGWDSFYAKSLVIVSVVFFSISVYWWYWALNKLIVLLDGFNKTNQNFEDIKSELRQTREAIKNDVGNR